MNTVETVKGSVAIEQIGRALPHEHIFTKNREIEDSWPHPEWLGEDEMVRHAAEGLNRLKSLGIDTIVDLTVPGLGRFIPRIQEVADRTDVHIVVATGYYTFDALPTYFKVRGAGKMVDMEDPLPGLFIRDITEGISDTGVKASVIKVATDAQGITPDVSRVMGAAAIAHKETGVTISTHTHAGELTGEHQQDFFAEQGVSLENLVIGHSGDSADLDYLTKLMDRGSTLGMDRFGMVSMQSEETRIDTIVKLIERGYAEKLTLSQDAGFFSINTPPSNRAENAPLWRHDNISLNVLPELMRRGVSQKDIDQMMIHNVARILKGYR